MVLNGTFFCGQAAARHWIDQKRRGCHFKYGDHVRLGSGSGGRSFRYATKAGVLSLTRTLAVEWGSKYGIRTNAIAPGPIERTGGAEKLFESEKAMARTMNSVPLGRLGTPEEIAALAAFLLSDEASYINGDCITMDGGQWLNPYPF
nr:SDR family oxidoreductase [Bacillus subtilis]